MTTSKNTIPLQATQIVAQGLTTVMLETVPVMRQVGEAMRPWDEFYSPRCATLSLGPTIRNPPKGRPQ